MDDLVYEGSYFCVHDTRTERCPVPMANGQLQPAPLRWCLDTLLVVCSACACIRGKGGFVRDGCFGIRATAYYPWRTFFSTADETSDCSKAHFTSFLYFLLLICIPYVWVMVLK